MENTEEKAAYFAQYWGLNCICNDDFIWRSNETFDTVLSVYNGDLSNWYAQLTPLAELTDEDSVEVAKLALYHPNIEDWDAEEVYVGEGDINGNGDHWMEVGMRCWEGSLSINDQTGTVRLKDEEGEVQEIYNPLSVVDFLRSKGYALPFRNYSVEQLIEMGWIKLKH